MNIGDYVRTKDGIIGTLYGNYAYDENQLAILTKSNENGVEYTPEYSKDEIIKSSSNIIDLIEVGDYVNGHKVNYINKDREHFNISFGDENFNLKSKFNSDIYWLSKEDIKSIVTKEQFESMEYKVKE